MLSKKFFLLVSLTFLILFSGKTVFALDLENERPTPLWGVPSAEWSDPSYQYQSRKSYGHPESTITIRNTAPGTIPDLSFLPSCALNSNVTLANCFYFFSSSPASLLNSKSYVNNRMKSAVAVIRYGGINVVGDSYSASGNFAYWGRHLRQTKDNSNSNALWQTGSYVYNPDAQSYWDTSDINKNNEMTETIKRLSRDSKSPVSSLVFSNGTDYSWNARPFDGVCGQQLNCNDKPLYPEGRFWRPEENKNLLIQSSSIDYSNRGTFILPSGNLIIETSINPKFGENDAAIGFIVQNGNVVIRNNSGNKLNLRASIFVPNGNIVIDGSQMNLIGSFVAKNFIVDAYNGVNFIQDTRGEKSWPPGFRELKLPDIQKY